MVLWAEAQIVTTEPRCVYRDPAPQQGGQEVTGPSQRGLGAGAWPRGTVPWAGLAPAAAGGGMAVPSVIAS